MYGLHGRIDAEEGHGDELAGFLLGAVEELREHGCVLYLVSRRDDAPDAVYVYELWVDAQAHQDSLQLPSVQETISQARPIIVGMSERVEFTPLGGLGMPSVSP